MRLWWTAHPHTGLCQLLCCCIFSVSYLPSAHELAFVRPTMDRSSSISSTSSIEWDWDWDWPCRKAPYLPVEILSEIFLLVSQFPGGKRWDWRVLMLVCRHWHATILLTPGLHSQLTIRRATRKEVVQAFIKGRKTRLGVIVDINDNEDGSDFNAENFRACLASWLQSRQHLGGPL